MKIVNTANQRVFFRLVITISPCNPEGFLGKNCLSVEKSLAAGHISNIQTRPSLCITDSNCGTGELAHLEMIGAIVYQLTKDLSMEEIKKAGFDAYFVDHTTGIYPAAANGTPYNAFSMAVKGDVLTDLHEDLAADGTTA